MEDEFPSSLDRGEATGESACVLRTLRLQNFRCFSQLALELGAGGSVFVGANAQGKTSILEAACVLVRLQSPRTHRMRQLVKLESPEFGVAGEVFGIDRKVLYGAGKLGMRLSVDEEDVATGGEYLREGGLVVWMANDDLNLIRGSGEGRRHYLDFIGSQVDRRYRRALSRYRRALRARNLLLKERRLNEAEIAAYTKILIEEGTTIQEVRASIVEGLTDPVCAAQAHVSASDELLTLEYQRSGAGDLAVAYGQAWEKEQSLRQTVIGPHRDDLELKVNGLPAKDFASEGQQRTAALSLKLAQGQLLATRGGRQPIYLLDDVFGELDRERRNALMAWLPEEAQKLITTTTLDWLDEQGDWSVYQVSAGDVRPH